MALLNSRPTHSKFHRLTSLRREIHRPRLPIIRLTPIPGDPLPLNYVGCCDFKALRLNSPIQIQNRAIPPPAEAFESQSPTPPTPLAAADGRRILLSDVVVRRQREVFWGRKWTSLDIGTAGVVVATHLLTLLAPFHFNWAAFWVAISLYIATGLFGITLSFHRNLSHRSFKLPKWLEYLFAYCGVQALQVLKTNPLFFLASLQTLFLTLFRTLFLTLFPFFQFSFREIQLIGLVPIDITINFVIQKETHIVQLKGFGLAI